MGTGFCLLVDNDLVESGAGCLAQSRTEVKNTACRALPYPHNTNTLRGIIIIIIWLYSPILAWPPLSGVS
jgi:hypothetical protein